LSKTSSVTLISKHIRRFALLWPFDNTPMNDSYTPVSRHQYRGESPRFHLWPYESSLKPCCHCGFPASESDNEPCWSCDKEIRDSDPYLNDRKKGIWTRSNDRIRNDPVRYRRKRVLVRANEFMRRHGIPKEGARCLAEIAITELEIREAMGLRSKRDKGERYGREN